MSIKKVEKFFAHYQMFVISALVAVGIIVDVWNRPKQSTTITELYVFPIKSCAGVSVQKWPSNRYGLELDRQWVVAKENGEFLSQRKHPRMVHIKVKIVAEGGTDTPGIYQRGGKLVLSAPEMPNLEVKFNKQTSTSKQKLTSVDVWGSQVVGIDEGDEISAWFSKYLGTECRLLVKDLKSSRPIKEKHVPREFQENPETAFADGLPYLILNESSVDELNSRLGSNDQVRHLNFRGNIIVSGKTIQAFAEDDWMVVLFGGTKFYITSRCSRCPMPCNNIETAVIGKEPTKTLVSYRRIDPGSKYEPVFGVNAIGAEDPSNKGFMLSVGDSVKVMKTTKNHNRKLGLWNPKK